MKKVDDTISAKSADTRAMPRRRFLEGAVAAGAGLVVLPSGLLGGVNAPSNKLNLGLIGTWGRAAAHLNQIVTWDEVTSSDFQFCEYLDHLDYDSPAPVQADEEGYFMPPIAGEWKEL